MLVNPCFAEYGVINIAENFTQPGDYFDLSPTVRKVPLLSTSMRWLDRHVSEIVIGGGGIVTSNKTNAWIAIREIVEWAPASLPITIWGMGINDHGRFDTQYDRSLASLEQKQNVLIGLRDGFYASYAPCVSCMRPEFDVTIAVQREIGMYVHHAFDLPGRYPRMSSQVSGEPVTYFRRVIEFLASSAVILTNSYHGAYWATLLGRRVIVVSPFSNKFFGFRHAPVIVSDSKHIPYAIGRARAYPEALSECRAATVAFYRRVTEFRQISAL
jgi:hypothetical protein